jgi:D-alanyl-D-alanine carboxypeptidase (penicillin-binding protein 5/6)
LSIGLAGLFLSLLLPAKASGAAEKPYCSAVAAILMETATGEILYAKNPDTKRPPASTTKILTAILALELADEQEVVTVSRRAAYTEGATIGLRPGIRMTLGALVRGALIASGNDTTVAIAEHLAGSQENFTLLMDRKACLLGAKHSRFINPNGLTAPNHCSTARDLALIAAYAMQNPIFGSIVATKEAIISATDGRRYLQNTNSLLWDYKGANGVKTGTTNAAGQCLVASAMREGRQLLSVVLGSGDRWSDSARLLDYGFQEFYLETIDGESSWRVYVPDGVKNELVVRALKPIMLTLPAVARSGVERRVFLPGGVRAPVKKGQVLGQISLYQDGKELIATPLVAAETIEARPFLSRLLPIWQ